MRCAGFISLTKQVYHWRCGASVPEAAVLPAGQAKEQQDVESSDGTTLRTPLSEFHRKGGAQMGVWFGCALPDSFGDWQTEYQTLRHSVGLVDKNYRAYLEFAGPDRVRFLNAILTNDIKGLKENHGVVSLFLNPQGHILAELETYAFPDTVLCVYYALIRERLIPAMDKYIIMDDVTLTDRTNAHSTMAIEGPKAAAVAQALSGIDLAGMEELESREANVHGVSCRVSKRSPGGVAGAEFLAVRDRAEDLWKRLSAVVIREGGGPVGYKALNTV